MVKVKDYNHIHKSAHKQTGLLPRLASGQWATQTRGWTQETMEPGHKIQCGLPRVWEICMFREVEEATRPEGTALFHLAGNLKRPEVIVNLLQIYLQNCLKSMLVGLSISSSLRTGFRRFHLLI